MTRGGRREGAGAKPRLEDRRDVGVVLDRPSREKLIVWQAILKLSRSEIIRRMIGLAPAKPTTTTGVENEKTETK